MVNNTIENAPCYHVPPRKLYFRINAKQAPAKQKHEELEENI